MRRNELALQSRAFLVVKRATGNLILAQLAGALTSRRYHSACGHLLRSERTLWLHAKNVTYDRNILRTSTKLTYCITTNVEVSQPSRGHCDRYLQVVRLSQPLSPERWRPCAGAKSRAVRRTSMVSLCVVHSGYSAGGWVTAGRHACGRWWTS